MCHKFVRVNFGENINFLTGRNGSGKSAVLTALTVALGGKSSFTNRASSISKLLKEGENAGEVIVRIRNRGSDAYKPEVYGNSITIVRKLIREGSGGYKIKSASDRIISTRRDEITNICDYLNIEVDNPMTILTQDTARMFLANSTPAQKYQFFLKGTQLEKLNQDYESLEEKLDSIHHAIRRKQSVMPDIKKQVQELEKQWIEIEKVKELEENVNRLQGEKIWCKVAAIERKRDEERKIVEAMVEEIQTRRENIQALLSVMEEGKANVETLQERIRETQSEIEPLDLQHRELVQSVKLDEQNLIELENQVNTVRSEIVSTDRNIKDYEDRLHREKLKLDSRSQSQASNYSHQISVLQKQIANESQVKNEMNQQIEALEREEDRLGQLVHELEPQIVKKTSDVQRMRDNMAALRNQSGDQLSRFGANVPKILEEIDRLESQRRWRGSKPVGPFGRYVKLMNQKFGTVIESALDKNLNAFSVDNHDDYHLLRSILSKHRNESSVFIYKARGDLDISGGRPSRELHTIYDFIQVSDKVVLHQLIINSQIEKIVLVESHEEGDQLTSGSWPKNVQYVYSHDCFEFGNRRGGLQTRAMNVYRGQPRLVADLEVLLRQKESQLRANELEMEELRRDCRSAMERRKAIAQDKATCWERLKEANSRMVSIENKIQKVKESMNNDDSASQVQVFADLLETEKKKRETHIQQKNDAENATAQAKVLFKERKSRLGNITREIQEKRKWLNEQRNEMEEIQSTVNKATLKADSYKRKLESQESEYTGKFELLKKTESALREQITKCSAFCERVPVTRTEEEIDQELVRLNALVKRKEELYGSREAFYQKLVKKRELYKVAKKDVSDFKTLITYIDEIKRNRRRRYQEFKEYISMRAMRLFSELIQKRGYRGILELDHAAETLALRVLQSHNR
jgi:chromosome segregation ATPase